VAESSIRWTAEAFAALESVVRQRSGLIFQPLRRSAVEIAASRVMKRIGVESPDAFVPLVQQAGAIFDDLMAEVTIGETYFFREAAHFTLLRKVILPEFRARQVAGQRFRAWSAGCSTGEEPYSISLALREEKVPGTVVGTDVSRARLGAARRGEYRRWSFRGVPEPTIDQYFARNGDTFTLLPTVRRDVDFRYLNLASDCYPEMSSGVYGMDVIFCRNVLIYFDRDTITHVATQMMAALSSGGWLLLGATDPPLHEYVQCEVVQTEAGLAYRHFRGVRHRTVRQPAVAPLEPIRPPPPAPTPAIPAEPPPSVGPTSALSSPEVASHDVASREATSYEAAADAYVRRDYERTISLIASAATRGDASAPDFVLYIRALANLGRLDEAGRACATALDRYRDNAELHYLHAVLVAQSGQFVESARAAKRALYLDRSMIVAHLALATALASSDDDAGARRSLSAAERLLSAMPADAAVPGTDGEPAGRLLEMTRVQAKLVRQGDVEGDAV
jgi:chemotaxis protein methyltransferase CheR